MQIPKELQLPHGEVEITRRGRFLVITSVGRQDGHAISAALTAFEGMPEREQPEERDGAGFDREGDSLSDSERRTLIERVAGSLARDDGRDMTQEFLDELCKEAMEKGW